MIQYHNRCHHFLQDLSSALLFPCPCCIYPFPIASSLFDSSFEPKQKMEAVPLSLLMGLALALVMAMASLIIMEVSGQNSPGGQFSGGHYSHQMRELRELKDLKASLLRRASVSLPPTPAAAPFPSISPSPVGSAPRVYRVTSYGADPTGVADSTDAMLGALSDAFKAPSDGTLMQGIANLGGARIDLEGGSYRISRPLRFPATGAGNLMIHGGTLKASDNFPADGHLIDLSSNSSSSSAAYNYEFITLRDLMLDSNYRGGGIAVINSLRTTIDNCYVVHFNTTGILIQAGHETFVHSSFLGQHITTGNDPGERRFSGTAINIMGNDNAVTDVVIFSAAVGVMVSGQANTLSGVHCYNKATGFGGTGIYLKLPGLTQTRIVNCYLDYTGIVAEDPVQLHISSSFFLGDAFIVFKSIKGVARGVSVVGNMFSGSKKGVEIVQLDQRNGPFKEIDQVVVDGNNVDGMKVRATVARDSTQGNGTSWSIDFNPILLFPNLIRNVQYSFLTAGGSSFPIHALRNMSGNQVVIESNVAVPASVFVTVDQ